MSREEGFVAAGREHGAEVIVERFGSTTYPSGLVLARRLLTRELRPDGIFCANDLLACGVMDAARHQFNLSIPSDLCVIGFDDIEQAGWGSYNLTTFAQPVDQIAREAVAWLSQAPPAQQNLRRLEGEMIWRGSVRGG
jgi:DNA-binding LacI/PurR family transcriptional regulator